MIPAKLRATGKLSEGAADVCRLIIQAVLKDAPRVEHDFVRTEDDGAVLEFTDTVSGREIAFVIPEDASLRYFVARGPNRFRKTGLVVDDAAVSRLANWLVDQDQPFPDYCPEHHGKR